MASTLSQRQYLGCHEERLETQNRKKFCSRIATGDYDAIIIGHSQFEKIPMSLERQQAILERQIEEILEGIEQAKHRRRNATRSSRWSVPGNRWRQGWAKLNDQSRKDDVVTFEQLGIDRIFIDESTILRTCFWRQNAQRGRHCPDPKPRNPAICL